MLVKIGRVYTDDQGESHWKDEEIELKETIVGPNIPPIFASVPFPTVGCVLWSAPAGMYMDWHPAPRRQITILLAGQTEGSVSDGRTRISKVGDIVILEDTTGKGHTTRVLGSEPALFAIIPLAD
jgi:quercetin dioxygenase-like cupin family protein